MAYTTTSVFVVVDTTVYDRWDLAVVAVAATSTTATATLVAWVQGVPDHEHQQARPFVRAELDRSYFSIAQLVHQSAVGHE